MTFPHAEQHPDRAADQGTDPRIERTLTAVAEAAERLLLEDGPDGITHARVATEAGVSRTTVYKYFPERADLLFATASAIGKDLAAHHEPTGDLRADLRTFVADLRSDLADPVRTRLFAMAIERALHDDAVAAVRDAFVSRSRATFASIVERAVADGELAADTDVDRGVAALVGSLLFVRLLTATPVDDDLVEALIDDFVARNSTA